MQWSIRAVCALLFLAASLVIQPAPVDAYARCNCTAYAAVRRPDLPKTLGNAMTWGTRARKLGFPVDSKPRVGDIMVLQPGVQGASRRYGHVAYVIAVQGNRVTVREMNGGDPSCRVIRDVFHTGRGVQFIHPKPKKKITAPKLKQPAKPAAKSVAPTVK